MPSQHAAHVVKIHRHVRHHDDGGRIGVLATETGGYEQDNRHHQQDDDARGVDGKYEAFVTHIGAVVLVCGTKVRINDE